MKTRVISAVVLIAVTLTCISISMQTRILFFALAAVLSTYEMCKQLKGINIHISSFALYLYIAGQTVLTLLQAGIYYYAIWFTASLYIAMVGGVVRRNVSGEGAIFTVAGLSYPCVLFSLLMVISTTDKWLESLVIGAASVWTCDCFALLGGSRFGKHKCAPAVSPHKTWEGCICGSASAIVMGVIVYFALNFFREVPFWLCVFTSFVSSIMGQFGDLAESLLKRMIGIKDFSNLIPGHGGMFDRSDSLLFGIPTAYFCLKWLAVFF